MTTIAYKDGVMASDSKITDDGHFVSRCQKIHRLPNGALLGTAGDSDNRDMLKLLAECRGIKSLPTRTALAATKMDFAGILVFKGGDIYLIDVGWYKDSKEWAGSIVEHHERFAAVGSGWQYALGAMAAGRNAAQACAIAARYDTASGLPIRVVALRPGDKA